MTSINTASRISSEEVLQALIDASEDPSASRVEEVRRLVADQLSLDDMFELWSQFGDVPVLEGGEIDEPFLHFQKGTDREDIWRWFEAKNAHFVVGDALAGKRPQVDRAAWVREVVNRACSQIAASKPADNDHAFELTLAGFDGGTDATDYLVVSVGAPFDQQELGKLLSDNGLYPGKVVEISDLPKDFPRDFELPLQLRALASCVAEKLDRYTRENGGAATSPAASRDAHATVRLLDAPVAVLNEPDPRPVLPLDASRPLYDEAGAEQAVVAASARQVVTKTHGVFGVWDVRTGESLIAGCEGVRLSNEKPNPEWIERRRNAAAQTFAGWHAEAAVARASIKQPADRGAGGSLRDEAVSAWVVGAAEKVLDAHRAALGIQGDTEIQVWHLLATVQEYCAVKGVDLDTQLKDVRQQIAAGDLVSPAWEKVHRRQALVSSKRRSDAGDSTPTPGL